MSNENLAPSIPEMLRVTGKNTAEFMEHVARHIEKLETDVARLTQRIEDLENGTNSKTI